MLKIVMAKKKQISDYKDLKQVAVVLNKEDLETIQKIKEKFEKRKCIGDLTVASILRYGLRQLDPEQIFRDHGST